MTDDVALEGRGIIKRMTMNSLRDLIPESGINCMCCGSPTEKNNIHRHHINLDSTDDRLCNFSLICRICHRAAHTTSDKGWRRSLVPIDAMKTYKINNLKVSWEERFNGRFSDIGGIEGFKAMYSDNSISLADIGIRLGCVRERVRQYAGRLGLPPRGKGFTKGKPHQVHGFPYRHKPLSDYLYSRGLKPAELAEMIGKSKAWTYQLLGMNRPITASMAMEIMNATGNTLTIDELMNPLRVINGAGSAA